MKTLILSIFFLNVSHCFSQKIKRSIESCADPGDQWVSQIINEYDTLGRKKLYILTENEDTSIYQFQFIYYYDENNKLASNIEKYSEGLNYTIYYYTELNRLYKSETYNSKDKIISYKLYGEYDATEYLNGDETYPFRVQTTILDSFGNQVRFYGCWETTQGEDKWDYKFVNQYSKDKKLIKVDFYKLGDQLTETSTFEYNSLGLMTREIRTPVNGKAYNDKCFRYEYY